MKYLFTAHYNDGTSYAQTQEDISTIKEGKSAYYDINHDKLVAFELKDPQNPANRVVVHLTDGGIEFFGGFHSKLVAPEGISDFRLIYFRNNSVITGVPGMTTIFNVGWQATVNGHNHKRLVEIY